MKTKLSLSAALAVSLLAGCAVSGSATGPGGSATAPSQAEDQRRAWARAVITPDPRFQQLVRSNFQTRGIVSIDRINQDDIAKLCSKGPKAWDNAQFEAERRRVQEAAMATIRWPSDGRFFGDWRQGNTIAQSGRGGTYTDDIRTVNGGSCFNCHQMTAAETNFGTIGPSLWQYGRIRGVTDLNSPAAEPMIRYTWSRLWNSRAFNACGNMPRFGYKGFLSEEQLRHMMSFLLDPTSPVNQ